VHTAHLMYRALRRSLLICTLASLLAACGEDGADGASGANGAPGTNGSSAMLAVTAESPGLNCLNGGSRVDSGLDANRNGQLDASEIASSQYVCSGGSAVTSLVETHDEAAGANCPSGGKRFTAGLDANGNGVLDASEMNSSGYICNGEQGSASARGLTAVVQESAGANCPSGGVKINSGSDDNGNGTLDVAEITGTQFVCNGATGANGTPGANATNTVIRADIEAAGSNCTYGGTRISAGPDTNANATLEPGEVTASAYACNGVPGPGVIWQDVTGTSVQAIGNRGYVADNDTAEVVVTLPETASFGDLIQVNGIGAGGWRIAQNAGQFVVTPGMYSEVGTVWTARESNRNWRAVASSSDGQRLVAAVYGGQLYTSSDAGVSWTARASSDTWRAVASSADGQRLVAGGFQGVGFNFTELYTSSDAGVSWGHLDSNEYWNAVALSSDGQRLVAAAWDGQLYISDVGGSWTARESNRAWNAVASSADGQRLVAAVTGGQLYISSDAGVSWTARESNRFWEGLASSSDGQRLVAAAYNGQLYTSSDAGVSWTARESNREWQAVASSSDGQRLVAAAGQIYTSSDAGVSWTARESNRGWSAVASSSDGQRLVAAAAGGQLYTSARAPRESTTAGVAGSISGRQYEAITLQYVGANKFVVFDFTGDLIVQ
jgi:hypothetical protein